VRLATKFREGKFDLKFLKLEKNTSLNKAQQEQELLCGSIFGSGRNAYVLEEPF
jgi:hypothetical protein